MDLIKLLSNNTNNELFYGLPIINPMYSQMCLSFTYFVNGTTNDIDLNLYVIKNKIKFSLIWTETTRNSPFWKKAYIDINTSNNFQIALQVLVNNNSFNILNNLIAVDSFKIVYGYCIKEKDSNNNNNNKIDNRFFLKTSPPVIDAINYQHQKQHSKRSFNTPSIISLSDIGSSSSEETCGGIYNLKFGKSLILQSPGYPFSYAFNKKCVYLIKVNNYKPVN